MIKRLTIVLLMLCLVKALNAQLTNGIVFGLNYSWFNEVDDNEEHKAQLGYSAGYRWDWQLSPKWNLGITPSLNMHYVETTYQPNGDVNKASVSYASIPLFAMRTFQRNVAIGVGYQYSYLLEQDVNNANRNDHAVLVGVNYKLGNLQARLSYQQSLWAESYESKVISGIGSEVTDVTSTTCKRNKLSCFLVSVYFPLGHSKK